jgi:hypothetical protein
MALVRNRATLLAAAVAGVVALLATGFWLGRANPGSSTVSPELIHGTVVGVGGGVGGTPVNEFVVKIDGSNRPARSYGIGSTPWTDETADLHESDTPPPCIAVGRHITFGVARVAHGSWSIDEVVWVDCTNV